MKSFKKIEDINNVKAKGADEIEWTPIFRTHGNADTIGDMDLFVSLYVIHNNDKAKKTSKRFHFKFGPALLKKMGVELGQNVLLCYDKDDQRQMLMMKHEKGYRVSQINAGRKNLSHPFKVEVPAGDWCVLNAFTGEQVAYTLDKENRLIFRIKS